jgi:hypothetical protein
MKKNVIQLLFFLMIEKDINFLSLYRTNKYVHIKNDSMKKFVALMMFAFFLCTISCYEEVSAQMTNGNATLEQVHKKNVKAHVKQRKTRSKKKIKKSKSNRKLKSKRLGHSIVK